MGYTRIAGTPLITGLFTILLPMAVYAVFGSSRHLVVGADSATAAVLAAGLVGIASIGSPEYVAYAGLLALMAAAMLIAARLVRLGFLADFLSRTVLTGFLTGVGVQVAIMQIPDMLGLTSHGAGPLQELVTDVLELSKTNLYSLAISIITLAVIFGVRRGSRKVPVALIAVIAGIIACYTLNLASVGVSVLGTIPGGLPRLGLPSTPLNQDIIERLLPTAFSMFIIILAQSAATSRAYAARYSEEFDENRDLIGLGIANIAAGLSGTFVVNGSPTKTEMVDNAGGRSQLAQLTTVCIVLVVLLVLTGPLSYLPTAVLAAIVFVIAIELVEVKEMSAILAQRPSEFWVAVATAGIVIFVGVEQGILAAIVLSLLDHVRRGYRPSNTVISIDKDGHWQSTPVASRAQFLPGLIIYRFNHSMYYANTERFKSEILELATGPGPRASWLCLVATAIDDVDFSAAATLRETFELLRQRGIHFVLAEVQDSVRAELDRYKITELIGNEGIFKTIYEMKQSYNRSHPFGSAVSEIN